MASFASLQPALLARKGGARPAMRPQIAPLDADFSQPGDDLGWNDFGVDAVAAPAERAPRIVSLVPSASEPVAAATPRARRSAAACGRRAAFTLRLDPERHLKLRLACALDARSAQALVTDALDRLLAAMPDIEPLAEQATTLRRGKSRPAKA